MKIRRLFGFIRRTPNDIAADVDEELRFHLDRRAEALVGTGVSPTAAREQALREFGDLDDARPSPLRRPRDRNPATPEGLHG